MEFADIVKTRRSVRQYTDQVVPEETIQQLLEMIRLSVSAINLQPWRIKIVADRETREKLLPAAFGMTYVRDCSHLLVLCADTDYPAIIHRLDEAQKSAGLPDEMRERVIGMATEISNRMTAEQRLQWSQNQVYIALGNAVNGAHSLGLGACPMTAFNPGEFARILDLPPTVVPTVMVSVGYPDDKPVPKLRHSLEDILV
jgi:nitroreductase/dihydropteridine reductase